MPTSGTSRGGYNLVCPAALKSGRKFVDVGFAVDGLEDMKVVRAGTGPAVKSKFQDISAHCETQVIYISSRFKVVSVDGGTESKVGVGDGSGFKVGVVGSGDGRGAVGGGGPIMVVGPPTGPEQTSPSGQHPIFPLLARAQ